MIKTFILSLLLVSFGFSLNEPDSSDSYNIYIHLDSNQIPIWDNNNLSDPPLPQLSSSNERNSNIRISGDKSIGFSTNQKGNIYVDQITNLKISGKLDSNLYINAQLTDQNIPDELQGNTVELREIDQIFLKIHNPNFYLQLGDFQQLYDRFTYSQATINGLGLNGWTRQGQFELHSSIAQKRSQFERIRLQINEGQKANYSILGRDSTTVILIPGTVQLWINGQKMEQDKDFFVEYGNGIIHFDDSQFLNAYDEVYVQFEQLDKEQASQFQAVQAAQKFNVNQLRNDISVLYTGEQKELSDSIESVHNIYSIQSEHEWKKQFTLQTALSISHKDSSSNISENSAGKIHIRHLAFEPKQTFNLENRYAFHRIGKRYTSYTDIFESYNFNYQWGLLPSTIRSMNTHQWNSHLKLNQYLGLDYQWNYGSFTHNDGLQSNTEKNSISSTLEGRDASTTILFSNMELHGAKRKKQTLLSTNSYFLFKKFRPFAITEYIQQESREQRNTQRNRFGLDYNTINLMYNLTFKQYHVELETKDSLSSQGIHTSVTWTPSPHLTTETSVEKNWNTLPQSSYSSFFLNSKNFWSPLTQVLQVNANVQYSEERTRLLQELYEEVPEGTGDYSYDSLINEYYHDPLNGNFIYLGTTRDTSDLELHLFSQKLEFTTRIFPDKYFKKGVLSDIKLEHVLSWEHKDSNSTDIFVPLTKSSIDESTEGWLKHKFTTSWTPSQHHTFQHIWQNSYERIFTLKTSQQWNYHHINYNGFILRKLQFSNKTSVEKRMQTFNSYTETSAFRQNNSSMEWRWNTAFRPLFYYRIKTGHTNRGSIYSEQVLQEPGIGFESELNKHYHIHFSYKAAHLDKNVSTNFFISEGLSQSWNHKITTIANYKGKDNLIFHFSYNLLINRNSREQKLSCQAQKFF